MIPFVAPPQPLSMFGLSVSIFGLFTFAAVIVPRLRRLHPQRVPKSSLGRATFG